MSEIALYNVLTKLGATPDETKEAAGDVASSEDVVTNQGLLKIEKIIAELETRLTRQMYAVAGIVIAASVLL